MIAPADRGSGNAGVLGPLDNTLHGEDTADLSHRVAAINHDHRSAVGDDARAPPGIDPVDGHLFHVLRDPQHPVGMRATQIGGNQRIGQQESVIRIHAGCPEHRFHEREKLFLADANASCCVGGSQLRGGAKTYFKSR